jgi:hypothetical protein
LILRNDSDFNKIFTDWNIKSQPGADATAFWQYLFVKHQKELAETKGKKEANDIPSGNLLLVWH